MSVLRGILVGGVTSVQTGTGTQEIGRASVSGSIVSFPFITYSIK